ncbi:hypothetical protein [Saccharothrix longispora]|uniref:hypothetical protein n=1 Tax=Saccharothrix longispora TaxID=33920 RepID=UPI0028FD3E7E|nr:hypothetical protein [Saccharothrix longispora]MBY8847613.1 hypothetical protein [Saccharothrix sp. MB29]MDU0289731.1 hypothetical protein [Saccharothrix longispora]
MAERTRDLLRWAFLAAAAVLLVVFLVAQRQSVDVSYGQSPSRPGIEEGSAGELSTATVPSVEEMTAMVADDEVVRLPGSIATWDERAVRDAIGDADVRVLVAPPGLDEAERDRVNDVGNATVTIVGTHVTGDGYAATADRTSEWRAQFATGDVTHLLLSLVAAIRDQPTPDAPDTVTWREPTAAEVDAVAADLAADGLHVAAGATLERAPESPAFPDGDALYAALPRQEAGAPVPRYGPALTARFPDRPVVVLYGDWVEYDGPHAAQFADVAAASLYGQLGERLGKYAYPQRAVLGAWLDRVTDIRYAGLFDRPLPYVPFDPLRVALPALPWLFGACVAVFLVLSARSARGRADRPGPATPGRLARLTTLAIEVSGLTDGRSDPALTRGIGALRAAADALAEHLPDAHVRSLLDTAEAEFDEVARHLGRPDYRPRAYTGGGAW